MPTPAALIFLKSCRSTVPAVTCAMAKSLPWKSPLHYALVITVFCLMNLTQAVRLWIMDPGESQEHHSPRFAQLFASMPASQTNPAPAPRPPSSVLMCSELIEILTYGTLGWISLLTSVEHPCQVKYCVQQHSRGIIFALKLSIFRNTSFSIKCHLCFYVLAWKLWL